MTIDRTGKYWTGTSPEDIEEYLKSLIESEGGYDIHRFKLAACSCGNQSFFLEADTNEGGALRKCVVCGNEHFLCDSEEYWEEAEPETWKCECGSDETNIGVGFSLYDETDDVRWLSVGCRCTKCGILGCFADWKVGYGPSSQLMDQV